MKRTLCISLVMLSLTIVHTTSTAQLLVPNAHFKFDNTLTEFYSNQELDTTAAYWSFQADELNNPNAAVKMAGGVFIMPDPSFTQFGLEDFTFSLWFQRTQSLWPAEWLFSKGNTNGHMKLRYNGFFDQMVFYFRPDIDTAEIAIATASNSVGLDNWSLYTVTVDRDGEMKMYQDGLFYIAKDISHVSSSPADFFGANFRLGCQDIVVNDLLFFNKALDSSEVFALYNHELDIDKLEVGEFLIYPNPAVNVLKVKSKESIIGTYTLFTYSGKLVQEGIVVNNEIPVGELSAGKYELILNERSYSIVIQ